MKKFANRRCCVPLSCFALIVSFTAPGEAQQISAGDKTLPLPGEAFKLDGHNAFIIAPAQLQSDARTPWVWYAPTLRRLPGKEEAWMIQRFLQAGIAIAGIDVGESYGSPDGRALYAKFYEYLTKKRSFRTRPVLLARSRGGLMLYSWAAENPESVAAIAGIYPVCNIASYPGLKRACGAYNMTEQELRAALTKHNPVDRLQSLAKARVPIRHLHGDSDKIVPLEKNSGILGERYKQLGGPVTIDVVKGQGHNMWTGWFQNEPLTRFIIRHATADSAKASAKSTTPQ